MSENNAGTDFFLSACKSEGVAMENIGLITFDNKALTLDLIVHEMAHQVCSLPASFTIFSGTDAWSLHLGGRHYG